MVLGAIPSRTIKMFKNRILHLSNPHQELNTNKIHRANYFFKRNQHLYKKNYYSDTS